MSINCIVVDDTPLAVEKLEGFIRQLPALNLLKSFNSGIEAISFLQGNPVDLVFLDIQMEQFSGLQFLEALQNRPKIIIVSAYSQFAVQGFEYAVTDYLLKPYSFERFLKAVEKVQNDLGVRAPKAKIMTLATFRNMESLLPADNFMRVHKSYIVAMNKIESIERGVIRIGGEYIPVGHSYRERFYKEFNLKE